MQNDIAIKVENLNKCYKLYNSNADRLKEALSLTHKSYHRDHYALHNVSFDIPKGQTVGIIGTNGSGKSTLLKILTGVTTPTSGTAVVNGKISALLELGAGFNPEYTGMQNIYLNGTMMNYSTEEMEKRVPEIVKFADIGEFIYQPVKTYSSGMFARLAFAVAVNVDPDILIVDEALSVGDMNFQMKCMNRMNAMMQGGTTVLFVSHDMNVIRKFCTYGIWLNQGQKMMEGDVDDVVAHYLDHLRQQQMDLSIRHMTPEDAENPAPQEVVPQYEGEVARITKFEILNKYGHSVRNIELFEPITVRVSYQVFRNDIPNPVLGVAIKDNASEDFCGVNTSLDHVSIPWKLGLNQFCIHYPQGLRCVTGEYHFDTGLFDETTIVRFDYIEAISRFRIVTKFCGHGKLIVPHVWQENCPVTEET